MLYTRWGREVHAAITYMRRSEETFSNQFFPPTTWVLRLKLRLSGLVASAFTCWATWPILFKFSESRSQTQGWPWTCYIAEDPLTPGPPVSQALEWQAWTAHTKKTLPFRTVSKLPRMMSRSLISALRGKRQADLYEFQTRKDRSHLESLMTTAFPRS